MSRRAVIATLLVVVVVGVGLWLARDSGRPSGPPAVGWARLDQALDVMVEEHHLEGAAMIVLDREQRLYERTLGTFTKDTFVTTGSASKWVSAVAVLALVDDGVLQLDAPLSTWIPSFRTPGKGEITLRQALSHRTGLDAKHDCLRDYQRPLQECVDRFSSTFLNFRPGAAFGYGSLSYHAAAAAAERATGRSWREIFDEKVISPLGLTNTQYGRHGLSPNPGIAGNLCTSAEDAARFLEMMLGDGTFRGKKVLSPEMVAAMGAGHAGRPGQARRVFHVPDRHEKSVHDIYGLGVWRDVVNPAGEVLVLSAPGKFGFVPWVDRRVGVAGALVVELSEKQLEAAKPPDPGDVIYLVCDVVYRERHPQAPTPNPYCMRIGVQR